MTRVASDERRWSLAQLEEESRVPARTIRYYIARGILTPPLGAGRGAAYGQEHLERLARIKELQRQGLTLSEVGWQLDGSKDEKPLPEPWAWFSYQLTADVIVMVRPDVGPWRLKRVRKLISQMAVQLNSTSPRKE